MNTTTFSQIEIQKQYRQKRTEKDINRERVIGFDTETEDGYAFLVTASTDDDKDSYWLSFNSIEPSNFERILSFLSLSKFRGANNFFYNISFDFNAIIKYLLLIDTSKFEELYYNQEVIYKNYKITYLPRKLFSISKNKHRTIFFDISQFYYHAKLDDLMNKYYNVHKNDENINKSMMLKEWLKGEDKILDYCFQDSLYTRKLAEKLLTCIYKDFNFIPKSYYSQADLSAQYVQRTTYIPTINKIDKSVLRFGFYSYHGGRFEIFKRGFFDKVYEYDLSSAYPFHISNLIDYNHGIWKTVNYFDEEADKGFYFCYISTKTGIIQPFLTKYKNLTLFPEGGFFDTLTQDEILAYRSYAKIKVLKGKVFYAKAFYYPFRKIIYNLYEKKKNQKEDDPVLYMLYKIMMNGLYGKFWQINPNMKTGQLFNPLWACEITANTRIQVFELAKKYETNTISIATDSCCFTKPINEKFKDGLGQFELQKEGLGVFLISGIYAIKGEDGEIKRKFRGFQKNINLFEELEKYKNENTITVKREKPVTFGQVISNPVKRSYEDINLFFEQSKILDINGDTKRLWDREFENCQEVLESNMNSRSLIYMNGSLIE